ncbi:MAG: type II secretion system F family protein [Clostridia bacterium]|nr:type II secretion system F family protein [Clostridia bacterium]MBQ7120838.1 type II secretion system F family protein [Clostridia bacterium]
MVLTIIVLVLSTVATGGFIFLLLTSSEYEPLVEPLDDKSFPLKFLYCAGFKLLDMIKFKYTSKGAIKLRREAVILYGEKYGDYYLRVFFAQRVSLTMATFVVMSLFAGFMETDSVAIMFVMAAVLAGVVYYYFMTQAHETIKKLSKRYISEFPSIVSTLALLVNAGMVLREAWDLIAASGESEMHEQMKKVTEDRNNGMVEADAFNAMARRCATPEISKFVSMVIQGLDKGSSDLAYTLKEQSDEMWELKQQKLLQEGEKASGKLLIPIMVMFAGILVMIMLPIMSSL